MTEAITAAVVDDISRKQQIAFKQNIATVKAESMLPPKIIGRILGTTERQVLLWLGRQPSKADKTMMIRAESLVRRIRNLGIANPRDTYRTIVAPDQTGTSILDTWIFEYNATSIREKNPARRTR